MQSTISLKTCMIKMKKLLYRYQKNISAVCVLSDIVHIPVNFPTYLQSCLVLVKTVTTIITY